MSLLHLTQPAGNRNFGRFRKITNWRIFGEFFNLIVKKSALGYSGSIDTL
jgi:hypothetical protein